MLKADLHIHTKEDLWDGYKIPYTAKEIIDIAAKQNYDVLAITNHGSVTYNDDLNDYAKKKGILLIPGIEANIQGVHILLYNFKKSQLAKIKRFEDLINVKRKNNLVIAPHPFFFFRSIGNKLTDYIGSFDAIEHSFFHTNLINYNKKAVKIAKKYNKPIVGNSDSHDYIYFGSNYSLIDSNKDVNSVIGAIKQGKVKLKTRPISNFYFIRILFSIFLGPIRRFFNSLI